MNDGTNYRRVALAATVTWAVCGCGGEFTAQRESAGEAGASGAGAGSTTERGGASGGVERGSGGASAGAGDSGVGGAGEQGGVGGVAAGGTSSDTAGAGNDGAGDGGTAGSERDGGAGAGAGGTAGSERGGGAGAGAGGTAGPDAGGAAGASTGGVAGSDGVELGDDCTEDGECASQHCADGVCCESACGEVCSRCDAPGSVGSCVATANDDTCPVPVCPESTECRFYTQEGGDNCVDVGLCLIEAECSEVDAGTTVGCQSGDGTCDGAGACVVPDKLSLGAACTDDAECAEGHCVDGVEGEFICCDGECSGDCQGCGADGHCDQMPADDSACPSVSCPASDACTTYPTTLTSNRCSAFGQCHTTGTYCIADHEDEGTDCGTGLACDGAGSCNSVCDAAEVFCGGGCVDPLSSEAYCGASGNCGGAYAGAECAEGEACEGGVCLVQCSVEQVRCDNTCIDPLSDQQYCGASGGCTGSAAGIGCTDGAQCISGRCRAWSGHMPFDGRYMPELAVAGNGNVLATWSETDGTVSADSLWVNLFDATLSRWNGAELIESSNARAFYGRPAGDPVGNFVNLWCQDDIDVGPMQLSAAYMTAEGNWQDEGLISNGTESPSSPDARIVMTSTGDALAVWLQDAVAGEDESLFWNRRAGGSWQTPQLLEQSSNGCSAVAIAADLGGGALAMHTRWLTGGGYELLGRLWDGSAWGAEAELASSDDVINYMKGAGDRDGNYYVAWHDYAMPGVRIRRYDAATATWQSPQTFEGDGYDLSVGVTTDGTPHLVWRVDSEVAWTAIDPSTGAWRTPALLGGTDPAAFGLDGAGNGFLVYGDDTAAGLLWRYLPNGSGTWTEARRITATTTDYVFGHRFVVDSQGRGLVAYTYGPGDGTAHAGYNRLDYVE